MSDVLVAQIILPHVGSTGKSTSCKAFFGGGGLGEILKCPCVVMSPYFYFSNLLNNCN